MVKLLILLAIVAGVYLWWQNGRKRPAAMRPAEARALLGVAETATLAEIREAHRRLIAKVHPDTGGSAELATRVNMARDALVAELSRARPPAP